MDELVGKKNDGNCVKKTEMLQEKRGGRICDGVVIFLQDKMVTL